MQLWKALAQLYPNATPQIDYQVVQGADGSQRIAVWRLPGNPPTVEALAAAEIAYDAAETQRQSDVAALRTGILAQANTAVGVAYASVTAPMVKALVWILLWKIGALNKDLTVKPLADWVRDS